MTLQPSPTPNDQPAVADLVMTDMLERRAHGAREYGTPLQIDNGRDPLQDLYEELLDGVVYARGLIETHTEAVRILRHLQVLHFDGSTKCPTCVGDATPCHTFVDIERVIKLLGRTPLQRRTENG